MAVFTRLELEGRLQCEVIAYFSPAVVLELANEFEAEPRERPSRDGLGLLAGDTGNVTDPLKAIPNRCKKMTVLYKIEPNLKLIYYAGFGLCTSSEILHAKRSAFKDPLRTREMKIILDIRYAELDVDIENMRHAG